MLRRRDQGEPAEQGPVKVSVVLPSFQHEEYVAEAVNSVLEQTHDNLELIVVDDASSDRTADVVAAIQDPRLRLVRLEQNRQAPARALGLGLATGDLIAFQNSDDVWARTKLAQQIGQIQEQPGVAAVFTRVQIIGADSQPAPDTWAAGSFRSSHSSSAAWLRFFFDIGNDLCISSALCRRTDLERVGGFNPALIQLSDLDLWVRLAALGQLRILEEELTSMRVVEGRNLSAPSTAVANRGSQEHASVLERFSAAPVRQLLTEIFPEFAGQSGPGPVLLAQLARYGFRHSGVAQQLFGLRLFERVLAKPGGYERIVAVMGSEIISEYHERRGRLVVTI
ncbi:MAG TPA: glycosyltransferase [Marmoricola sp.]|nr:glycosyltransferase [Marmoricola sp.]HNN47886.1 glycosyltransferase [Marmoricola sp.]HNO39725.1 glycosyltransferase [Marmoricola sp.]